ncbi:MAG: SDR family NAD(P)-dependent oxidoreductase [Acidimicrobiales bacterium]
MEQRRVVIVTGAGNGIGRAIAERFGAEGDQVVVNDVDGGAAQAVANTISAAGGAAISHPADISDVKAVADMFGAVLDQFGTVDVLVNNAGLVGPMLHFLDGDEAWFRKIIDVNLMGTIWCCRQAGHIMARNGHGVIINMSSGGATRAHRQFTAYDATKGGIEALTRAMAIDLGPYGVRVNALMPGSVDTSGRTLDELVANGADIPLERQGTAVDLAGPAVFLASADAGYVTGDILRVDGGLLSQQRSATVDICPPSGFPVIADVKSVAELDG